MVTITKAHHQAIGKLLSKPLDNEGIRKALQKFTPQERTVMASVVLETMRREIDAGWSQGQDVNAASNRMLSLKDQFLNLARQDSGFFELDRRGPGAAGYV